jgi:hypothetical protein
MLRGSVGLYILEAAEADGLVGVLRTNGRPRRMGHW